MKKTYMKPSLYVESFSLTQSIAKGCTAEKHGLGEPSHGNPEDCGWDFSGATFFTISVNDDCRDGGMGELELVCYNAPNGNIMFAS